MVNGPQQIVFVARVFVKKNNRDSDTPCASALLSKAHSVVCVVDNRGEPCHWSTAFSLQVKVKRSKSSKG